MSVSGARFTRPRLAHVRIVGDAAEVTLVVEGEPVVGRADLDGDPVRAAAAATLDAVSAVTPSSARFSLGWVGQVDAPDPYPALVTVIATISLGPVDMPLAGTALLRDSPEETAARATLAAVNRRLELLQP